MAWLVEKNWFLHGPNFEIIANPDNTKLINNTGICSFLPWNPSNQPVVARHKEPYKGKLDVMTIVGGPVGVSRKFRDLVETFEPGVHVFAPLILERKNGERFEEDYFLFTTQQDIDCLITENDPNNFEYLWTSEETGHKQILCRLTKSGREVPISVRAIADKHLWTAGLLGLNELFVSDEFMIAMRKTLRGRICDERRCVDVDRAWIAEEQMGPLLPRHQAYVASGRTQVDRTLGEIWE
jgi:hypothetical protein